MARNSLELLMTRSLFSIDRMGGLRLLSGKCVQDYNDCWEILRLPACTLLLSLLLKVEGVTGPPRGFLSSLTHLLKVPLLSSLHFAAHKCSRQSLCPLVANLLPHALLTVGLATLLACRAFLKAAPQRLKSDGLLAASVWAVSKSHWLKVRRAQCPLVAARQPHAFRSFEQPDGPITARRGCWDPSRSLFLRPFATEKGTCSVGSPVSASLFLI